MFDDRDLNERFRDTREFRALPTPVCLNYLEAKAFPNIAPERQYHVNVCLYCSTMVKTVVRPRKIALAGFLGKLVRAIKNFFLRGR